MAIPLPHHGRRRSDHVYPIYRARCPFCPLIYHSSLLFSHPHLRPRHRQLRTRLSAHHHILHPPPVSLLSRLRFWLTLLEASVIPPPCLLPTMTTERTIMAQLRIQLSILVLFPSLPIASPLHSPHQFASTHLNTLTTEPNTQFLCQAFAYPSSLPITIPLPPFCLQSTVYLYLLKSRVYLIMHRPTLI